jgi:hypothetical protein
MAIKKTIKKVVKKNTRIILNMKTNDVDSITEEFDNNEILYNETINEDKLVIDLIDEDDWKKAKSIVIKSFKEGKSISPNTNKSNEYVLQKTYTSPDAVIQDMINQDMQAFENSRGLNESEIDNLTNSITGMMEADLSTPDLSNIKQNSTKPVNSETLVNDISSMMK